MEAAGALITIPMPQTPTTAEPAPALQGEGFLEILAAAGRPATEPVAEGEGGAEREEAPEGSFQLAAGSMEQMILLAQAFSHIPSTVIALPREARANEPGELPSEDAPLSGQAEEGLSSMPELPPAEERRMPGNEPHFAGPVARVEEGVQGPEGQPGSSPADASRPSSSVSTPPVQDGHERVPESPQVLSPAPAAAIGGAAVAPHAPEGKKMTMFTIPAADPVDAPETSAAAAAGGEETRFPAPPSTSAEDRLRGAANRRQATKQAPDLPAAAGPAVLAAKFDPAEKGVERSATKSGPGLPVPVEEKLVQASPASAAGPVSADLPVQRASAAAAPEVRETGAPVAEGETDGAREIVSHTARGIADQARKGDGEVTVVLKPREFGEIRLHVRMEEGRLHVEMMTQKTGVRETLLENLPLLRETLQGQNVRVETFQVSLGGDRAWEGGGGRRDGLPQRREFHAPLAERREEPWRMAAEAPRTDRLVDLRL